jgi:hypothetical protein
MFQCRLSVLAVFGLMAIIASCSSSPAHQNTSLAEEGSARAVEIFVPYGHGSADQIVLSRDGRFAVSSSTDGTLKWWDLVKGVSYRLLAWPSLCLSGCSTIFPAFSFLSQNILRFPDL